MTEAISPTPADVKVLEQENKDISPALAPEKNVADAESVVACVGAGPLRTPFVRRESKGQDIYKSSQPLRTPRTTGFISIPPFLFSHKNLNIPNEILAIRRKYRNKLVVYGIYNNLTHKIYIGSTMNPFFRFRDHFVRLECSNVLLQNSIKKYGLSNFTLYIFSLIDVEISQSLSKKEKLNITFPIEQKYIEIFPKAQLYNLLYVAGSVSGFKYSDSPNVSKYKKIVGKEPANKGKKLTDSDKLLIKEASKHRYNPVYFFDDMNNLVTVYESFNHCRRIEKCNANKLLECIKENKLFKGFKVSYSY